MFNVSFRLNTSPKNAHVSVREGASRGFSDVDQEGRFRSNRGRSVTRSSSRSTATLIGTVEWLSSGTQTTSGLWALETRAAPLYRGGEPADPWGGDAKHVESPGACGQSVSTDAGAGGALPLSGFQTNRLESRRLAGSISSFYRWQCRRCGPWRHDDSLSC